MKIFFRMIVIYLKKIKKNKMIQMNFRKKKMRQE